MSRKLPKNSCRPITPHLVTAPKNVDGCRVFPQPFKIVTNRGLSKGLPGPPGPSVIGIITEGTYFRESEELIELQVLDPLLPGIGTLVPLTYTGSVSTLSSLEANGYISLEPGRHVIEFSITVRSLEGNDLVSIGLSDSLQLNQVMPETIFTYPIISGQTTTLNGFYFLENTDPLQMGIVANKLNENTQTVVVNQDEPNLFFESGQTRSAKVRIISYPLVPV